MLRFENWAGILFLGDGKSDTIQVYECVSVYEWMDNVKTNDILIYFTIRHKLLLYWDSRVYMYSTNSDY